MAIRIEPGKGSLLRAAPRLLHILRVLNPGEFFLLTRAFVIMESMMQQLDPHFDFMAAFRDEIKRLTAQHFSMERIKDKTGRFAREMERMITDAPGDTRRALRRLAEGNMGRLQSPAIEALGGRINRNIKRLTDAIAAAALLIGGVMLVNAPRDSGWHHFVGELLVAAGVFSIIFVGIAVLRKDRGRGLGRR